ncbi:hypothetical protein GCM10027428_09770 [Haliea atlantica]
MAADGTQLGKPQGVVHRGVVQYQPGNVTGPLKVNCLAHGAEVSHSLRICASTAGGYLPPASSRRQVFTMATEYMDRPAARRDTDHSSDQGRCREA